jgi:para-nitrobenzyl esterase
MRSQSSSAPTGIILAIITLSYGCGGGPILPPPPVISVSVSAASPIVSPGATDKITAVVSNDSANIGVSWSVTCPNAPCGSVSPASTASGVATTYTASASPPASGVMATVSATSVTDPSKVSSVIVTVASTLMISTVSLSDGTVGAAYSQTIQATGGVAPFKWGVFSLKGGLPAGLTLVPSSSNSVTISGTPTTVQNMAFFIQVADASGQSANQSHTVTIKSTVAQTPLGALQGKIVPCGTAECSARNVLEFLGIPYAAPPVANLRWKPPQPATPWTGTTRDAIVPGSRCIQVNGGGKVVGSEDCLYLNIFISSQTPHSQQLPVMVYIHGGANRTGTGLPGVDFSDPPPLATQGVILVTLDFRVGILGFFTHPLLALESSSGSSGNYGLRDQIAALAWVHQNIVSFGGDPAHVMVVGTSSGSSDVEALLASPLTQGLLSECGPSQGCFTAAGMESGSVVHGQSLTLAAKEAQDAPLVAGLGCDTAADVLACLRALPAASLVNNPSAAYQAWNSGTPLSIVNLEPDVVPMNPFDWLLQQHGSPVPLLLGSNREDAATQGLPSWCTGGMVALPLCPNEDPTASPPLDATGYGNAIHAEFDPPVGVSGADTMLTTLYPVSGYDAPVWALIAVDSDLPEGASCPYREVARAAAGANGKPVWRYVYTHTFENDPNLTPFRAFHGAQLPFVFGDPSYVKGYGPHTATAGEITLAGQMMGYWTRFAATGDPNGSGATVWPRYDATTDAMLQLDDTSTQINGYRTPQCDFYDANATVFSTIQ